MKLIDWLKATYANWQQQINIKQFACPWCGEMVFSLKDKKTTHVRCTSCGNMSRLTEKYAPWLGMGLYIFLVVMILCVPALFLGISYKMFMICFFAIGFIVAFSPPFRWLYILTIGKYEEFIKASDIPKYKYGIFKLDRIYEKQFSCPHCGEMTYSLADKRDALNMFGRIYIECYSCGNVATLSSANYKLYNRLLNMRLLLFIILIYGFSEISNKLLSFNKYIVVMIFIAFIIFAALAPPFEWYFTLIFNKRLNFIRLKDDELPTEDSYNWKSKG